ncbi:MAG: porin family protein [Candidatus Cloacimonetes bacterium]|jgi:hypothetical protein|nr:porin family protein [Candidatus Cloacimonadota bacterium]
MKKIIFAMCLIFAITLLNAQLINSYGFKGGLCIANQDFDYYNDFNIDTVSRYGFVMGGFIELLNNENFHLLAETHYVQKGNNVELDHRDENGILIGIITLNSRVDYLEFDVLGKYAINLSSIKPYLITGPRFNILIDYNSENNFLDPVYEDLDFIDFGLSIGAGFEFQIIQNTISLIEFRYSPPLTSSYETDLLTVKNTSFEILTGIKF